MFTQGAQVLTELLQEPTLRDSERIVSLLLQSFRYQGASDVLYYWFATLALTLRNRQGSHKVIAVLLEHAHPSCVRLR